MLLIWETILIVSEMGHPLLSHFFLKQKANLEQNHRIRKSIIPGLEEASGPRHFLLKH